MHLDDALDRFTTQLEADGRSPHTIGQYRRHVHALCAWLGPGRGIEAVGHEDLARFLAAPEGRTRALGGIRKASTMNAVRSSLKGFFGYVHRAGHVSADPSRLIRRAITGPPPPKTLSDDEQRRLLDVLGKADDEPGRRDHALFHLMLATGIRIGSALALDVGGRGPRRRRAHPAPDEGRPRGPRLSRTGDPRAPRPIPGGPCLGSRLHRLGSPAALGPARPAAVRGVACKGRYRPEGLAPCAPSYIRNLPLHQHEGHPGRQRGAQAPEPHEHDGLCAGRGGADAMRNRRAASPYCPWADCAGASMTRRYPPKPIFNVD